MTNVADRFDAKMRWVRINIAEILEGIEELTWEQRGFYLTALFKMYARMGGLPSDDYEGARIMRCDVRFYRRLRDQLTALDKLSIEDGELRNRRVDRAIAEFVAEAKKRRDAAVERETKRRLAEVANDALADAQRADRGDFAQTSPELRPEVGETSLGSPADLPEKLAKKHNEINESGTTTLFDGEHSCGPNQEPRTKNQERRRNIPPNPPRGADAIQEAFERWWSLYPSTTRKVGKGEAAALFRQALTGHRRPGKRGGQKILDHGQTSAGAMIVAIQRYVATRPDPEFVPAPCTWLNQGRWLDHAPVAGSAVAPMSGDPEGAMGPNGRPWGWWRGRETFLTALGPERWAAALDKAAPNGTWPWWLLGAPPGHAECVVPKELVGQRGLAEVYRGKIVHD